MYGTFKSSVWKHLDFILWDIVVMQLAYLLAYAIRHGAHLAYASDDYLQLAFFIILIQLCYSLFSSNYKGILRRGFFKEFTRTVRMVTIVILISLALLFLIKTSDTYSRVVVMITWVWAVIFIYAEHLLWKQFIRARMRNKKRLERLVIVSSRAETEAIVEQLEEYKYKDFYIEGILLLDEKKKKGQDKTKEKIHGCPVAASGEGIILYLQDQVVDRVFLSGSTEDPLVQNVFDLCKAEGITIHYSVSGLFDVEDMPIVDNFCGQSVVTYSTNYADSTQLMMKRLIDIVGGIVGLICTGILTIFLAPIIYIQSPGPIFFSQERIGKNGRTFRIYKFRSMYPDAEKRLQGLMDQNKLSGPMVKIENDPRIIPIGHFIRKTSLDEFPQFWNVLKGEMSLVGTRPPTVDEYEQYKPEQKIRLAFKPGLTGLWQVSGRSDIVDFDEVVKLDKQYIDEWSIRLDLRIILKTLKEMVTGSGAE